MIYRGRYNRMMTETTSKSYDASDTKKKHFNAYQREYYKNKVDQAKRKQQFRDYYIKNKEAITAKRNHLRALKKQQTTADVTIEEVVSL